MPCSLFTTIVTTVPTLTCLVGCNCFQFPNLRTGGNFLVFLSVKPIVKVVKIRSTQICCLHQNCCWESVEGFHKLGTGLSNAQVLPEKFCKWFLNPDQFFTISAELHRFIRVMQNP